MLERFQAEAKTLLDNGELVKPWPTTIAPQGKDRFTKALAALLSKELGWDSARNTPPTNGSQNAFFYLFNLLAGEFRRRPQEEGAVPARPEYIGYADSALGRSLRRLQTHHRSCPTAGSNTTWTSEPAGGRRHRVICVSRRPTPPATC